MGQYPPLFVNYLNTILVLGQNPLHISQTQSFIFEFFLLRGIHVLPCMTPVYVYDGFTYGSGFFYPGPSRAFMVKVSNATLYAHMRVLKVLVKSSIFLPPTMLIQKLNKQVRQACYLMYSLFFDRVDLFRSKL